MAETDSKPEQIAVAFWCSRELAAKVDSVAERELMTRSTWLRRLVASKVRDEVAA